jgi:very-short-patch-repair endonuclease
MTCAERKPRGSESAAREIADQQFGVISHRQARDAGFSDPAIARRVKAGLWDRVLARVYRIGGATRSREQLAMAAALWGGDDALVSHGAAAMLWDFDGARAHKVELWVRLRARLDALRTSGRPGGGRLEALLDARGDGRPLESALETLVWPLILRAEVPLPVRQHWLVVGGDRYRLDFAWPDVKVALECDGYAFHGGVRVWNNSEARLAEFAAVKWRVLPVTWDAASRQPERVIRWLRSSLSKAAERFSAP